MDNQKHISDFLSADEQKLSILALCLISLTIIAGASYIRSGDISTNLKDIIETIAFLISGVNIGNQVTTTIKKNIEQKNKEETNAK